MPYFSVNASASSADNGAVPEVTARTLSRSSRRRSEWSTMRSAVGTSDTARGRCRALMAQRSNSNCSNSRRSGLSDALQHPENATDVHERCVDDRDAASWLGGADQIPTHHASANMLGEVNLPGGPVVPLVSIAPRLRTRRSRRLRVLRG
jgi:hypothetical protein